MSYIGKSPCDDGAVLHGARKSACSAAEQRATLIAAILGSSMAFMDGTVVNVALPAIQQELHATAGDAQWVVQAYALFLAALLLVGGALGDRFGRKRMFMLGVAAFTAASAACGLANSVAALIVARSFQGIGAALLVPGSLALISAAYPESQRGKAIGTWSGFSGVAAAVGPVIGGYLIDHFSWSWAFLMNIPLGVALLAVCFYKVPESRNPEERGRIDLLGAGLVTAGLAGIVYACTEAQSHGWGSSQVAAPAVVGVVALVAFLLVEAKSDSAMVPLQLFRNRDFLGANLLTLFLYAALGGGLYFFPLNLIQVQGYGATAAGAALLPFVALMFSLSRWAGQLVDRFGPRGPLIVGPLISAGGFAMFAVPSVGHSYWVAFFPAVCVLGLGMSITVAPLTTTVMNSIGAERSGLASGINNAVSRAAAVLALALFGIVMAAVFDAVLTQRLGSIALPQGALAAVNAERHQLGGMGIPAGLAADAAAALKQAIADSFVSGFRAVMLICAGLGLASALCTALLIRPRPGDGKLKPAGS